MFFFGCWFDLLWVCFCVFVSLCHDVVSKKWLHRQCDLVLRQDLVAIPLVSLQIVLSREVTLAVRFWAVKPFSGSWCLVCVYVAI